MLTIGHIVNPVSVTPDRDLHWQQPITFESMRIAKEFAKNEVNVEQVACFYPEDEDMVSDDFIKTDPLEISALDIQSFEIPRKLPVFREMFQRLYETSDADYFIQTNADIGLYPHFYLLVKALIEDGHDSFCINKRILPEELKDYPLALMWSFVGGLHNGHDCFVFRRELCPALKLGNVLTGTPWSEGTLIANLVAYAKNFTVFKNAIATFHLGDRRIWLDHKFDDYRVLNLNEFARILKKLSKKKKSILKHESIKYLLGKLVQEVTGYKHKTYSKDCWEFIN